MSLRNGLRLLLAAVLLAAAATGGGLVATSPLHSGSASGNEPSWLLGVRVPVAFMCFRVKTSGVSAPTGLHAGGSGLPTTHLAYGCCASLPAVLITACPLLPACSR